MTKCVNCRWTFLSTVGLFLVGAALGCDATAAYRDLTASEAAALENVKTVAVMPFVDAPGLSGKDSGRVVLGPCIAVLNKCPGIAVVERARLIAILDELDLQRMDAVDNKMASKIGKRLGADVVILGEVMQYEAQQEYGHMVVYVVSGGATTRNHRVGIAVRAVNVKTAQIIYAEIGDGTSKDGFAPAAKLAANKALGPWWKYYEKQNAAKQTKQ